ncbi:MAG: cell division protein ZapE [Deltaproteobacteria bacterium]|nr:MAG: cell division protein ZapE [Deltaproteobacteria bacterium]
MTRSLHPCVDPACPECRGDGYVLLREGERARATACDCLERYVHQTCRACHGEGFVDHVVRGETQRVPCQCRGRCPLCRGTGFVADPGADRFAPRRRCQHLALSEAIARFDRAGLPARFAKAAATPFRHRDDAQLVALGAAMDVLKDFERGEDNRGLVLYGPVGRGKTHLLAYLLRRLVFEKGVTARFVEFSHLLSELKASFDRGTAAAELVDPLVAVDVLVIDELGKGRSTEWELTVIDELVSRRYNAGRAILASTNFSPGAATGRRIANNAMPEERVTLADRVGERVYSRLNEVCSFVEMPGRDYRQALSR